MITQNQRIMAGTLLAEPEGGMYTAVVPLGEA